MLGEGRNSVGITPSIVGFVCLLSGIGLLPSAIHVYLYTSVTGILPTFWLRVVSHVVLVYIQSYIRHRQ